MELLLKLLAVAGVAVFPWGEIMFAIPLGIATGLPAVLVWVTATIANLVPVLVIAGGLARTPKLSTWLARSGRTQRAQQLMQRYGVPGLSLQAPLLTGAYVAAVVALLLGGSPRRLALWMAVSLSLWGVLFTILSLLGFELVTSVLR